MILSLEEDEEEFDLQDVTQNVITVDDEYINGPMTRRLALRQPETVSVCSCTCYPGLRKQTGSNRKDPWYLQLWYKCQRIQSKEDDDDHIFCAETMSISKSKKYAVKRNSMWKYKVFLRMRFFLVFSYTVLVICGMQYAAAKILCSTFFFVPKASVISGIWLMKRGGERVLMRVITCFLLDAKVSKLFLCFSTECCLEILHGTFGSTRQFSVRDKKWSM